MVPSTVPTPVPEGALTVYSGRSESLVAPIVARFTEVTGIPTVVDYGNTTAKTAQILEEGAASPADVFFSQDAGALQELTSAGLLAPLADETLALVPEAYRAGDGTWAGASGRARVAAYSTDRLTEDQLPGSILGFTDPAWKGRIGWAPTNASLLSHVTAMRAALGEDATRAWLEGIKANEPVAYEGNSQAVEGVANGEIDVALVNHYYLWNLAKPVEEAGGTFPVANHYFDAGDLGALVNVAGLGVLASSDQPTEAAAFVDFLLSTEAQTYFAESTSEYPLVAGVPTIEGLVPLADLGAPPVGLGQLEDLAGTLALMRELELID
jgi:iron(III) transport system substrate-binding protein